MGTPIRRKATTAPKPTAETGNVADALDCGALISSVASETIAIKIKATGEYASWGIEAFHSRQLKEGEDASEALDNLINELDAKVQAYAESCPSALPSIGALSDADLDAGSAGGEELGGEPDELTEEAIGAMSKKELVALIKEEKLDVDPKEHKKLADLVAAVIAAVFPEEDLTEEGVREMDREELINLIAEQELEINADDFKKTADLTDAVVELLFAEDLTPEAVREMSKEELLQLVKDEKLKIDMKPIKKIADLAEAIIAELFVEEPDGGELEEFGDFENTDFGNE